MFHTLLLQLCCFRSTSLTFFQCTETYQNLNPNQNIRMCEFLLATSIGHKLNSFYKQYENINQKELLNILCDRSIHYFVLNQSLTYFYDDYDKFVIFVTKERLVDSLQREFLQEKNLDIKFQIEFLEKEIELFIKLLTCFLIRNYKSFSKNPYTIFHIFSFFFYSSNPDTSESINMLIKNFIKNSKKIKENKTTEHNLVEKHKNMRKESLKTILDKNSINKEICLLKEDMELNFRKIDFLENFLSIKNQLIFNATKNFVIIDFELFIISLFNKHTTDETFLYYLFTKDVETFFFNICLLLVELYQSQVNVILIGFKNVPKNICLLNFLNETKLPIDLISKFMMQFDFILNNLQTLSQKKSRYLVHKLTNSTEFLQTKSLLYKYIQKKYDEFEYEIIFDPIDQLNITKNAIISKIKEEEIEDILRKNMQTTKTNIKKGKFLSKNALRYKTDTTSSIKKSSNDNLSFLLQNDLKKFTETELDTFVEVASIFRAADELIKKISSERNFSKQKLILRQLEIITNEYESKHEIFVKMQVTSKKKYGLPCDIFLDEFKKLKSYIRSMCENAEAIEQKYLEMTTQQSGKNKLPNLMTFKIEKPFDQNSENISILENVNVEQENMKKDTAKYSKVDKIFEQKEEGKYNVSVPADNDNTFTQVLLEKSGDIKNKVEAENLTEALDIDEMLKDIVYLFDDDASKEKFQFEDSNAIETNPKKTNPSNCEFTKNTIIPSIALKDTIKSENKNIVQVSAESKLQISKKKKTRKKGKHKNSPKTALVINELTQEIKASPNTGLNNVVKTDIKNKDTSFETDGSNKEVKKNQNQVDLECIKNEKEENNLEIKKLSLVEKQNKNGADNKNTKSQYTMSKKEKRNARKESYNQNAYKTDNIRSSINRSKQQKLLHSNLVSNQQDSEINKKREKNLKLHERTGIDEKNDENFNSSEKPEDQAKINIRLKNSDSNKKMNEILPGNQNLEKITTHNHILVSKNSDLNDQSAKNASETKKLSQKNIKKNGKNDGVSQNQNTNPTMNNKVMHALKLKKDDSNANLNKAANKDQPSLNHQTNTRERFFYGKRKPENNYNLNMYRRNGYVFDERNQYESRKLSVYIPRFHDRKKVPKYENSVFNPDSNELSQDIEPSKKCNLNKEVDQEKKQLKHASANTNIGYLNIFHKKERLKHEHTNDQDISIPKNYSFDYQQNYRIISKYREQILYGPFIQNGYFRPVDINFRLYDYNSCTMGLILLDPDESTKK